MSIREGPVVYCDFCNKSQHQVARLVAGARSTSGLAAICNECIDLCNDIIREETCRPMVDADIFPSPTSDARP